MIYLKLFLSLVLVLTLIALGVLAIKKATDFLGKRFGPGVGLAVFVVLYSSFIITLVTALLGTTK